jgi:hypothetical protein
MARPDRNGPLVRQVVARETRTLLIGSKPNMHVIDVESRLASADWDFTSVQRATLTLTCGWPIP